MSETFLDTVIEKTRERVARVKSSRYLDAYKKRAEKLRANAQTNSFRDALAGGGINIIAEIKRASPSKGSINLNVDVARQARQYQANGASAISVLTEPDHFQGSIDDLLRVREAVDLPVLRKDFIVDEFQVYEAAAAGADAILLIAAALSSNELRSMIERATNELRMDALVEVHSVVELQTAIDAGADLIGVNNRDLRSLEVSLETSRELAPHKPNDVLFVAESGISKREEIDELRSLGFDGFLIGEALMRSPELLGELSD